MVKINLRDVVSGADTADQGRAVLALIRQSLSRAAVVSVSFAGINTATSSFVNTAFVPLLALMSFDDFKKRVLITEASRQAIDMFKSRLLKVAMDGAARASAACIQPTDVIQDVQEPHWQREGTVRRC